MSFTNRNMRRALSSGLALAMVAALATGCSSDKKSDSSSTAAPATTASVNTAVNTAVMGATIKQSAMVTPRGEHTATSTPNGVLVVGGENQGAVVDTIERYNNGSWGTVGKLAQGRKGHSATLLSNGKLLVIGGQADASGNQVLDTAEIVDPVSGSVQPGPAMNTARSGHVAVAFRQGTSEFVLVAGGANAQGSLTSAEVYDVANNAFLPLATKLAEDRAGANAVLLPNGKILIQGGLQNFSAARLSVSPAGAQIFDPASNAFSSAGGGLSIDRYGSALALSDSGQAIALGGNNGAQAEASAESYDPSSNSWSNLNAALATAREALTATVMRDTRILAVGGADQSGPSSAVEAYDAATDEMIPMGSIVTARRDHTSTLLSNGNVLIVGGYGSAGTLQTAEEYSPTAPPGTKPAALPSTPAVGTPIGPVGPTAPTAPPPRIMAILPTKGKPGDLITIAGQNFADKKQDNQVMFQGGAMGKVLFDLKIKRLPILGAVQTLVVEVPQGAQTGDVIVISKGQSSPAKNFKIDLASAPTPSVVFTLPKRAKRGGIVSILGRNFARPAKDNTVRFNGEQATIIGGITTQSVPFLGNLSVMLVRVPSNATSGDLTIEAYTKTSRGKFFEIKDAPASTPASTGSTGSTTPSTGSTAPGSTAPGSTAPGSTAPGSTAGSSNTVFYSEDFEGASLSLSQQGGVWEAARPNAAAGPSAPTSGQWLGGTGLTSGSYAANAHGYLLTREIDLSSAKTAKLRFNQFFDTDGMDAGRVIISPDGGQTYYLLRPTGGYLQAGVFSPAEGFTGFSGSWLRTEFDLAAFVGDKVTIAFEFKADGANQRSGWFVDDIVVEGTR